MKKLKHAILGLLFMSLGLAGCNPTSPSTTAAQGGSKASNASDASNATQELKKVTFLLDWTPNTNHTGLYVAKEKGFFKEQGLDVTIQTPPTTGAAPLVGAGKAEFGIDAQDTMAPALTAEAPLPVTAIAAILQHNTSGIISRKGEGLDKPKGMEGKQYATWDNPVEKAMIKQVVEKDGGDFAKVKLIPNNITNEVAALMTKQADAIWIYYGWSGINAELNKLDFDYFAFKDLEPTFDYYTPVIITSDDFLKKDPETVKKFLAAAAKGYEFAAKNPEEAGDILVKSAPELDPELVKASQKWLADQYLADGKAWGTMDAGRWDGFYKWLFDNKLIPKEIPAGKGFTNDFLPAK